VMTGTPATSVRNCGDHVAVDLTGVLLLLCHDKTYVFLSFLI
jgi:hypothetical protein